MKHQTLFSVCLAALGSLSGCIIVEDGSDIGGLTVEWSIVGDTRAGDCDLWGARRTEIAIFDRFDNFVTELEPRCGAFGAGTELPSGRYFVEATLVDAFDDAVSLTLVEPVRIVEGTELVLWIDFSDQAARRAVAGNRTLIRHPVTVIIRGRQGISTQQASIRRSIQPRVNAFPT